MKQETMTQEEAALAWGQMKDVQIQLVNKSWLSIPKPGQNAIPKAGWVLGANVFHDSNNAGPFRLAPEPKLRPFTIEEWKNKVGSVVVDKGNGNTVLICTVYLCGKVRPSNYTPFTPEEMMEAFIFADGSPCGVVLPVTGR